MRVPFKCKLFTQDDMEIATYGDGEAAGEDGSLYFEFCSKDIETEYTEFGVGA